VEKSQVTGFILRSNSSKVTPTACVSRWKVTSLPSGLIDDLPGIGFPRWKVELMRIKNGRPGTWEIKWDGQKFVDGRIDVENGEHMVSSNNPNPVRHINHEAKIQDDLQVVNKTG
jgi:hypothetical protein